MKRKKQLKTQKTKELIKQSFNKGKGITLIALVITIIVLIILVGISISLILGQNGLFNKARGAATETAKARFLEDAGFAYSEAYIEKVETSNSNDITIRNVVSKLKSSYGYTDDQIKTVTSGVSGITLSETEVTLEPGETTEVTVELDNGTYYALIEGLYYPITLSNDGITLGDAVEKLPEGNGTTSTITAETTAGNELVDVTVDGTKITIKANDELEESGEATVTVTYGGITKEITVKIKVVPKQGDEVLGQITVTVNGEEKTLAQGWKFFYDDEDNDKVWLIYSGIMEGTAQQIGSDETIKLDGDNVYSSKDRDDFISYLNGTGNYAGKWDHIKTGIKNALKEQEIRVEESKIEVKGSPDIELFQKAYDQMYPNEKFEVDGNDTNGWKYKLGNTENFTNRVSVSNYSSKTLFIIGSNYYFASPSDVSAYHMCCVYFYTEFCYYNCLQTGLGTRPVVSIPKTVFDQLVGN